MSDQTTDHLERHPGGIPVEMLRDALPYVRSENQQCPMNEIDVLSLMCDEGFDRHHDECERSPGIVEMRRYHLDALAPLGFRGISMMRSSFPTTMSGSVERMMENDPRYVVMDRIRTSISWWGCSLVPWNELVDGWRGLGAFDIAAEGFEARLTHTYGCRENGPSEHGATWIDGHFAWLVHHRDRHVMTIGFSISNDRRILIQQIQATSTHGNRWMYRFPRNRLEHVVDRFAEAFPHHEILMVDGRALGSRIAQDYERIVRDNDVLIEKIERRMERRRTRREAPCAYDSRHLASLRREQRTLRSRHSSVIEDLPRLDRLYSDTGRHRRMERCVVNHLDHFRIDVDRREQGIDHRIAA